MAPTWPGHLSDSSWASLHSGMVYMNTKAYYKTFQHGKRKYIRVLIIIEGFTNKRLIFVCFITINHQNLFKNRSITVKKNHKNERKNAISN